MKKRISALLIVLAIVMSFTIAPGAVADSCGNWFIDTIDEPDCDGYKYCSPYSNLEHIQWYLWTRNCVSNTGEHYSEWRFEVVHLGCC